MEKYVNSIVLHIELVFMHFGLVWSSCWAGIFNYLAPYSVFCVPSWSSTHTVVQQGEQKRHTCNLSDERVETDCLSLQTSSQTGPNQTGPDRTRV